MPAPRSVLLLLGGLAAAALGGCLEPGPAARAFDAPPQEGGDPRAGALAAFVARRCMPCHDPGERSGEVALPTSLTAADVRGSARLWRRVRRELAGETMPPEEEPQPSPAERARAVAWIDGLLAAEAGAGQPALDPGRPTLRRLTRVEYDNSVRDLLGVTLRPGATTFPDDEVGHGFDRMGDVLSTSPLLLERYLLAAEAVAAEAVQAFEPLAVRHQAEAMARDGRGGVRRGVAFLVTNGAFTAEVEVPHPGEYVLRARACADQAGDEPARLAFLVDGRRAAQLRVLAPRAEPALYEARVRLEPGRRAIAAAFVNDFYQPEHPDPTRRDRNLGVDWVELEGPLTPPPLPPFHAELAAREAREGVLADGRERARRALAPLVERAFRRPARPGEVERLADLVAAELEEGESFERALRVGVAAVLISPHFLFKVELDPAPDDPTPHLVSEHELATRLSYFLWSTTPDDALLARARAGELRRHLDAEVDRLLDDPRASALIRQFGGQWLQLGRLGEARPDPAAFPEFDEALRRAMRVETELVLEAVLREDRSLLDLVTGRFTFANARLARHYGLPPGAVPEGAEDRFVRVRLPAERRGLLTHGSVLTLTSEATRTSPVRRGKWLLDVLLGAPPAPPPPGVGDLPDDAHARAAASQRERLARHRRDPACASCHDRIDPLGLGLERFDAVGARRTHEGAFPIDASGALPGGARFEDASGLAEWLAREQAHDLALNVALRLLTFALGRPPGPDDERACEALVRGLAPDYRFGALIRGLVRTAAFQQRRGERRPEEVR